MNREVNNERVRKATANDFSQIIDIWRTVFTNDNIYLSLVLHDLLPCCETFIYEEQGNILSVATLIPTNLKWEEGGSVQTLPGYYLYGVATLPEARGQGLSRHIVKAIVSKSIASHKKFIITRPAEPSLFQFYKSQGFSVEYKKCTILLPSIPIINRTKHQLTGIKLKRMREVFFIHKENKPLFCWSTKILTHAINTILLDSGEAYHFRYKNAKQYLISVPLYNSKGEATGKYKIEESSTDLQIKSEKKLFALLYTIGCSSHETDKLREGIFNFPLE